MSASRRSLAVTLAALSALIPAGSLHSQATAARSQRAQPALRSRSAPIIERDGLRFRDLNRNGTVDPYEDWRLTPEERARGLVARMTSEEKAGTMMHGTARTAGALG